MFLRLADESKYSQIYYRFISLVASMGLLVMKAVAYFAEMSYQ